MDSFKLIYAFHCCAHIEDIKDVFETVYKLLENDGTFIMEVGYFYQVFKKNIFDVIYHEHIDYHTCTAINKFADKCGLKLYKVSENDIQGGSIQFFMCKKDSEKEIENNVLENIKKESEKYSHKKWERHKLYIRWTYSQRKKDSRIWSFCKIDNFYLPI